MRIVLIAIGKTDAPYLLEGFSVYEKRLIHYIPFELEIIPDIKNTKNLTEEQQKEQEGEKIKRLIQSGDHVVLLDERGKEFTSAGFAGYLEKKGHSVSKRLVFVIGGPYGFSKDIYDLAAEKISLSKMTFSHQMVRLFFIEQLYRAMTILGNEPYHHR